MIPTGFGVLAAALVLSIMILPTIMSISFDALCAVSRT
jgi:phosphate transport system permease protein